jgi:hypothetical protein
MSFQKILLNAVNLFSFGVAESFLGAYATHTPGEGDYGESPSPGTARSAVPPKINRYPAVSSGEFNFDLI